MKCGCIEIQHQKNSYKELIKICEKHPKGYLEKGWYRVEILSQVTERRNGQMPHCITCGHWVNNTNWHKYLGIYQYMKHKAKGHDVYL